MGGGKNPAERAYGMDKTEPYTRTRTSWHRHLAQGTGRLGTGIAACAVTIHLPRETLIPTPVLPFTTKYILHLHYPGRLSTGAGAH